MPRRSTGRPGCRGAAAQRPSAAPRPGSATTVGPSRARCLRFSPGGESLRRAPAARPRTRRTRRAKTRVNATGARPDRWSAERREQAVQGLALGGVVRIAVAHRREGRIDLLVDVGPGLAVLGLQGGLVVVPRG